MKFWMLLVGIFTALTSLHAVTVSGTVYDTSVDPKEPMAFANIEVLDQNKAFVTGATTGFEGEFSFDLNPGTYYLKATFIGYADLIQEVKVETTPISINLEMKSSTTVLTEAVFEVRNDKVTNEDILIETKDADGVSTTVSVDVITESGANDAGSGAKKMVGLSAVGSNVFVRGMGDRYNIAYVNGLPIASIDPDKKVIPLDLFGTAVIKSLNVNKTYDAANYGDYAGGAIDIRTKDYPGKFIMNLSLGTSMNTNSFGKDFISYEGSSLDFFGFGGKDRALPAVVDNADSYQSNDQDGNTIPFTQNFNPTSSSTPLNSNLTFQVGNFKELNKEKHSSFGYLVTASYRNGYDYANGLFRIINKQNDVKLDYAFDRYEFSTRSSVLGNVFYKITDDQEIMYNTMFLNTSSDQSRDTYGFNFDYQKQIFSRRQTYTQNSLWVNQLRGHHKLSKLRNFHFNWAASYNMGTSVEPDRKQLVYLYDEGMPTTNYIFNAVDRIDNHRFFSELEENELASSAEISYSNYSEHTEHLPGFPYELKVGFNQKIKSRVFDFRQFVYDLNGISNSHPNGLDISNPDAVLNDEGLANDDFYILEVSNPSSLNNISQTISAAYGKMDMKISSKIDVLVGARYEMGYQDIVYKDQQQANVINKNIVSSADLLPHVNLKLTLKEDIQYLKIAGSRTISRPGFKEVAPFEYTEIFAGTITRGNPELINGYNNNLDIRYEYYTKSSGLIAFAAFGKQLINPIERTMLATASGQLQSFQNSNEAQVAGVEAEWNQGLTLNKKNENSKWNNFNIVMNAAYMYSKVSLKDDANSSSSVNTNLERPLQGASPYLFNFDLGYTLEKENKETQLVTRKTKFTLAYNVFGRRVYASGIQGLGDQYELPVQGLNLSIRNKFFNKEGFESFNVNLSAKNLLNPMVKIIQETDLGDETINEFKTGRSFGLTVSYNF